MIENVNILDGRGKMTSVTITAKNNKQNNCISFIYYDDQIVCTTEISSIKYNL